MAAREFFNEMMDADGKVRAHYADYNQWLAGMSPARIEQKRAEADMLFRRLGITFAVYGEESGTERLIPFDIIPRVIPAAEWAMLAAGLSQRVKTLNAFLHDIYHGQEILGAGIIPAELIQNNSQFRPEMQGVDVPGGIYAHIAGVDIVRAGQGEFYVLEDNLRVPSGVSYMLEDRRMMMRLFPELFARHRVAPVEHYPDKRLAKSHPIIRPESIQDLIYVSLKGDDVSSLERHPFIFHFVPELLDTVQFRAVGWQDRAIA
jgi:uncharacterized circularly permuted ATP-grasp superfamily protein